MDNTAKYLCFYDRNKDLRLIKILEDEIVFDVNKQDELKTFVTEQTGIKICSPILKLYVNVNK